MKTVGKIISFLLLIVLFMMCAPAFANEQAAIDERFRTTVGLY